MNNKNQSNFNQNNKLNNLISKAKERNEKIKNQNPYRKLNNNKGSGFDSIEKTNLSLEERINILKNKIKGQKTSKKNPKEIKLIKIDDDVSVTKAIALLKQKQQDK